MSSITTSNALGAIRSVNYRLSSHLFLVQCARGFCVSPATESTCWLHIRNVHRELDVPPGLRLNERKIVPHTLTVGSVR